MNSGNDSVGYLKRKGISPKRLAQTEAIYDCWFCNPLDKGGHLDVNLTTGQYNCFKCHSQGNLITLRRYFGDYVHFSQEKTTAERILEEAVEFYTQSIPQRIMDYLHGRGISAQSIVKYKLGYAQGRLRAHLAEKGFREEDITKAGLLKPDGRDYFFKQIIIPYYSSGRVTQVRGRSDPEDKKQYLSMKGQEVELLNRDILHTSKVVAICEGELDCISLLQLGIDAVAAPGAGIFKNEWVGKFQDCTEVDLFFDGDRAGRENAMKIARILGERARVVSMPEGKDVNDLLVSGYTKGDFEKLSANAKTYLELQLESVKDLPASQRKAGLEEILNYLATLPDLDREMWLERLSKQLSLRKKVIIAEVNKRTQPSTKKDGFIETIQPEQIKLSEEEINQAEELLRSSDLLERLVSDCEKLGIVGEDNNKLAIYLALTSRKLSDPINLIVKGESSAGKSFLVNSVAELFPEEDILQLTAMSAKALYHRKDSLANKALIVYERAGSEEADYSIRSLQSEKKLIFSTVVKNPDTQRFETQDIVIEGPVAYVETTTRSKIHPENENRCFELFVDESVEQTQKIFEVQKRRYRGEIIDKTEILKRWKYAQRLLKPYPVKIPFVDLIKFPAHNVRARRDHQRFLALIEVSALLHQFQREKQSENDREWLVASFEDYVVAFGLANQILVQTIKDVPPKTEELLAACDKLLDKKSEDIGQDRTEIKFTRREIESTLGWDKKTVEKYLKLADKAGYLDSPPPVKGKATEYSLVRLPNEDSSLLLTPQELMANVSHLQLATPSQMGIGQVNLLVDKEKVEVGEVAQIVNEENE